MNETHAMHSRKTKPARYDSETLHLLSMIAFAGICTLGTLVVIGIFS